MSVNIYKEEKQLLERMLAKKSLLFFLILNILICYSCRKDDPTLITDVYVCGFETNFLGKDIAKYWRNGTPIELSNGQYNSYALDIYVEGSNVHVVGYEFESSQSHLIAKYWKNGVAQDLEHFNQSGFATSITGFGSDIYIAGHYTNVAGKNIALYWKNGSVNELSDGTYNSYTTDIFTSNGIDVYVAGNEESGINGKSIAKYWKNSRNSNLTNGLTSAYANAIFVRDTHVFIAGTEVVGGREQARIWIDGVIDILSSGDSFADDIYCFGTDYYVCGRGGKFWKNGIAMDISDSKNTIMRKLIVTEDTIYIAGKDNTLASTGHARLWKNNIATNLNQENINSAAYGLYVYKH